MLLRKRNHVTQKMADMDTSIKRIIINVDSGSISVSSMESAVVLASRLQANLCGLFIEDTELLQLANLPFTREITLHTAHSRELSSRSIERNLLARAAEVRESLQALAEMSNVGFSFRTVRGPRLESVFKEAEEYQLILMMPTKRLTNLRHHAALADRRHPVVIFYDGSVQSKRAIAVIKSMNNDPSIKHVLALTTSQSAEEEVLQELPEQHFNVRCISIEDFSIEDIIKLARIQTPGLMILPIENSLLKQGPQLRRLLDALSCMLILVR